MSETWSFNFAARGYKPGEPDDGGSTRIVWKHPSGWYLVMKLFDDNGNFPTYPRTLKFWKTPDFAKDRMEWASAANEFVPNEEEMASYHKLLEELWRYVPKDISSIYAPTTESSPVIDTPDTPSEDTEES
jgi:hypothetical protein